MTSRTRHSTAWVIRATAPRQALRLPIMAAPGHGEANSVDAIEASR
jgi:hypothetical protein